MKIAQDARCMVPGCGKPAWHLHMVAPFRIESRAVSGNPLEAVDKASEVGKDFYVAAAFRLLCTMHHEEEVVT